MVNTPAHHPPTQKQLLFFTTQALCCAFAVSSFWQGFPQLAKLYKSFQQGFSFHVPFCQELQAISSLLATGMDCALLSRAPGKISPLAKRSAGCPFIKSYFFDALLAALCASCLNSFASSLTALRADPVAIRQSLAFLRLMDWSPLAKICFKTFSWH